MYAEPVINRIEVMLPKKETIFKLMDSQWSNSSIAAYIGSDNKTINRFRKAYNEYGRDVANNQIIGMAGVK